MTIPYLKNNELWIYKVGEYKKIMEDVYSAAYMHLTKKI